MTKVRWGLTVWGIRPWCKSVKWWWSRSRSTSIRIALFGAVPAAIFSIRYGGWEASRPDYFEVSDDHQ